MAENQVTTMVIKVDLHCEKCAKKIKKVLCQIPEIQNQIYDKKANTVKITVVCCCPEKIKQKICCKGGQIIKGIEIEVPKPPPDPQPDPKKTPECVSAQDQKTTSESDLPKPPTPKPPAPVCQPRTCCRECYKGGFGGPCFHGCVTLAAPPCYGPPYGRPVYDCWGGGTCYCQRSGYYVCRCEYVCDDSRSPCIIM